VAQHKAALQFPLAVYAIGQRVRISHPKKPNFIRAFYRKHHLVGVLAQVTLPNRPDRKAVYWLSVAGQ
jgi:hypothetical protein